MTNAVNPETKPVWFHQSDTFKAHSNAFIGAYVASFFTFYGFVLKSSLQLDKGWPKMTRSQFIKDNLKLSTTVALGVGLQLSTQNIFSKSFKNQFGLDTSTSELAAALITGAVSIPLLNVVNGITVGKSIKDCFTSLNKKQSLAIFTRESIFVYSLSLSNILENPQGKMHNVCMSFFSGALCSLISHPADTMLTLWQKNKPVNLGLSLYKGAMARGVSVGLFSGIYSYFQS